MSKPYLLLLACLVVLACGPAPVPTTPPAVTSVPVAQVDPEVRVAEPADDGDPGAVPVTSADPQRGRRDAPVTIVEFSDFQCPFCGRSQATLQQLRERYGDKLRIVWKNTPLPFHDKAKGAAAAAEVIFERSGNDAFWATHDAFFGDQAHLADRVADALNTVGIVPGKNDLAAGGAGEAKVDVDMALGKELGVSGVPHFFINGVSLVGAQPVEKFTEIIDEQLRKAQALTERGTPARRVYAELSRAQLQKEAQKPAPAPKPAVDDRSVWLVPVGKSAVRGKATAPVTIVELADFQCPFCRRVAPTLDQVQKIYGDKVRLVFKHQPLPFHPHAAPAAELAIEARAQKGDKGFWATYDRLFQAPGCKGNPQLSVQPDCLAAGGTWEDNQRQLGDQDLLDHAKALGLDVSRVSAALTGHKHKAEIEADMDLADDMQANGTPHFFINGRRLVGAQPLDKFQAVIDEELGKAEALIRGGVPAARVYEKILVGAKPPPPLEQKTVPAPTRANPSRGPAGAKVVVQMFSDFQCPFCKRVVPTIEELEKAFPGKIRLVWRNLPLPMHQQAELAAEAAMEAFAQKGSAGFFAMHELLYANQATPGGLERPALEGYAAQIGLDPVRFAHALDAQTHKAAIDADAKVAEDAQITGTPAFVINGYYLSGAQALTKFRKVVARALAQAK